MIAKVATITLANISLLGADELLRIGFVGSIDAKISTYGLYGLTSAGVWVSRVDASGQSKVIEQSGANTAAAATSTKNNIVQMPDGVAELASDTAAAAKRYRRKARVPYTLVGGTDTVELVPALANYYGVIDSILVLPHDAIAAAVFAFSCPAGTAIESCELALVDETINRQLEDFMIHGNLTADASDGDAISLTITGIGVEEGTIIVTYHYET